MRRAACTIASANYLPYARTLCESFKDQHPGYEMFVLIVDRLPAGVDLSPEPFTAVPVEELRIPDFKALSFQYDILELNTNVKPTFMKWLLASGIDELIYFDPDIQIFSSVEFIYDLLHTMNVVLTPHATAPFPGKDHGLEQEFLSLGVFNLGFVAVSHSEEASKFLDWWEERCLDLGFADPRNGLFVDQKWANLAPALFDGVSILKHPGCNMAHWNIHERRLSRRLDGYWVNDAVPLVFYHFSGFKVDETELVSSKHRGALTIADRRDLEGVLTDYRSRLLMNGIREYQGHRYAFGTFSDGRPISLLARRVYSLKRADFSGEDPFDSGSSFYAFAKSKKLLGTKDSSGKFNALNYDKSDRRVRSINRALRLCLSVLGSDRYTMLMKYLSYITVLRNQEGLF